MARVRRSVSLEDHVPEVVAYISSVVGRDLPQPVAEMQDSERLDDASDEDDAGESHEPRLRGRVPIFEPGQRAIASLMDDIERGVIALPDLQRPFVWEDTQIRRLLDSLFVGFPVGTLVFWHTSDEKEARALATKRPLFGATTLVIDGQQRLTSLYAVMRGVTVVGKDGAVRKIQSRSGRETDDSRSPTRRSVTTLSSCRMRRSYGMGRVPSPRLGAISSLSSETKDAQSTKSTRTLRSATSIEHMRSATIGFLRSTSARPRNAR